MAASPSARLRLTAAMRLKERAAFAQIRAKGKRLVYGCLIANWLSLSPEAVSQLGVITGRKIGPAVQRNRARRLMREAFRLHQHEFRAPVQIVLVARPSIAGKGFSEVERDYLAVLRQGNLLKS